MGDVEVQQFFKKLVLRFRKENHLSDFTFAALETIPRFKMDFVHFFYPELKAEATEIELIREVLIRYMRWTTRFCLSCARMEFDS